MESAKIIITFYCFKNSLSLSHHSILALNCLTSSPKSFRYSSDLQPNIIIKLMSEVQLFEQRLKQSASGMTSSSTDDSIKQLKALEKDISNYMLLRKVEENDHLSQMQIAVFNNLACLYQKKGKYRTSLYHLQIAQQLENKYFTHKYHDQAIPLAALQKLSTTYSNLSAVQSKLGNYKEAILNAQFAIQILTKYENSKDHRSLQHLYYNYSFLLDALGRYGDSGQYALEGLRLSRLYADNSMITKYEALLEGLKGKLARRQIRKIKQLKKHIKGEIGVPKSRKDIEQKFLKEIETIELEGLPSDAIRDKFANNSNFTTLKEYFTGEKKHLYKPSTTFHRNSRDRHNSTYTTLNSRKHRNFSLTQHKTGIAHPSLQNNGDSKLIQEANKDIIQAELEGEQSTKFKYIPNNFSEYKGLSGKIRPNKLNSTVREGKTEFRIKSRKQRLQQQIEDLSKKNDVLSKIIDKIYQSEKKEHQ